MNFDDVLASLQKIQDEYTKESEEGSSLQDKLFAQIKSEAISKAIETLKGSDKPQEVSEPATPVTEDNNRDTVIGDTVQVVLIGFNGNEPVVGKVDTGATVCSLHATDIKLVTDAVSQEQLVTFTNNEKRYKMALETHQAVQTADAGIGYRPVVKFDVKYRDKVFRNILFNLNDRSEMPEKILLGKNFLEKGDFLIKIKPEEPEQGEQIDTSTTQVTQ